VAFLQLSWLAAVFSRRTVIPDHEPTPLPEGTSVSRVTGLPVSAKSAVVQAGRPESCAPPVTEDRTAETRCTKIGPSFGLSKSPDSGAAGPPG
jgi:hypothetical protein